MTRTKSRLPQAALALALLAAASALPLAAQTTDATNDFVSAYKGPKNGDLDIVSSQVFFDGTRFALTATMNGPIGFTPGAFYVFGFNRIGAAPPTTGSFNNIGFGSVLFDAVITVTPGIGAKSGNTVINDYFAISGNTIAAIIPLSFLQSPGRDPATFLWNLWPRNPNAPTTEPGSTVVTDFAPENFDVQVTNVSAIPNSFFLAPEPSSVALFGLGALSLCLVSRRRKTRA